MNGMVSNVYRENGIIRKEYLSASRYPARHILKHWRQEVRALKKLKGKKHFPQLLGLDSLRKIIYMSDCGEPLTDKKLPYDWKKQCKEIEKTLNEAGIYHIDFWEKINGIKIHKNILVKDGIINIIDFGLLAEIKRDYDTITKVIETIARNR